MRDRKEGGVTEERQKKYVGKYIREWDRGERKEGGGSQVWMVHYATTGQSIHTFSFDDYKDINI